MRKVLILADREVDGVDPSGVELIISLGDLWGGHIRQFAHLDVPKIGVYGNHCRPGYLEANGFLNVNRHVIPPGLASSNSATGEPRL